MSTENAMSKIFVMSTAENDMSTKLNMSKENNVSTANDMSTMIGMSTENDKSSAK